MDDARRRRKLERPIAVLRLDDNEVGPTGAMWSMKLAASSSRERQRGNRTDGALRSTQILVEPVQRALPGLLCSGFVVAGGRVVVETVIGSLIDMTLVRHAGFC